MKNLLTGKSNALKTKNFFKRERSNNCKRWRDSRLQMLNLLFLLLKDLHTLERVMRKAKVDLKGHEIDHRLVVKNLMPVPRTKVLKIVEK